jgi:hypothetical protein
MSIVRRHFCFFVAVLLLTGCGFLQSSPKYRFSEGYYKSRLFHKKEKNVYVLPSEDTIKIYTAKSLGKDSVDPVRSLKVAFLPDKKPLQFPTYRFYKNTLDVDVLSILFKYRPAVGGFPRQFNTTLNGAVYLGYRNDSYHLSYCQTPFRVFRRRITHFGYSFGVFTGFGSSRIDPFVTNNNIAIEYDGVVNLSGVAFIVGVNNLSLGITGGVDYLLDQNRKFWVNHQKPWFGLSVGLNIN